MAENGFPSRAFVRTFIFGSGTALYLFFANWAYAAMMAGDIRTSAIMMFLAWSAGVMALVFSETQGAFSYWPKARLNILGGGMLALLSGLVFFYFYSNRPVQPEGPLTEAFVTFHAHDPMQRPDGSYDFPLEMRATGSQPVGGYATLFYEKRYPHRLDANGLNQFMAETAKLLRRGDIRPDGIPDMLSTISSDSPRMLRMPKPYTAKAGEEILSGKSILYLGAVMIYSDASARAKNILYVAVGCFYYEPTLAVYVDCGEGHNVGRAVFQKDMQF